MRNSDRDSEFTDFVVAQRRRLVRAAQLLTVGDESWAEDLVQTTLTKVYLAWPKVRRADDPLRYAQRMLTNTFIDDTRRGYRGKELTSGEPADHGGTVEELPISRCVTSSCEHSPASLRSNAPSWYSGTGWTSTSRRPLRPSGAPPAPSSPPTPAPSPICGRHSNR